MRIFIFVLIIVISFARAASAVSREAYIRALKETSAVQLKCERPLLKPAYPPEPHRILIQRTDLIITLDRNVFWKGQPLHFADYRFPQGAPWRLLLRLADPAPGDGHTNAQIVQDVWTGVSSTDTAYRSLIPGYVSSLRRSFRKVDPDFDAIETIPNKGGYRWVDAKVSE